MITVGMQVHDEILVEEMVEFPLERNSDEATPLHDHPVECRSPVLQLRHGHKEQVVGFKDPGYLIDQSTDLSLPRMMNNLDRQDGIKKNQERQTLLEQAYFDFRQIR